MKYLDYVNIRQGTDSVPRFSTGNTLPLTQLPFAMAGFVPQTASGSNWFYHPRHRCLEGVRLTHQPSPWIGDYGAFLLTPQIERANDDPGWSGCRPGDSVLRPDYMKVRFLRQRTDFELTPTERGGCLRLNMPAEFDRWLTVRPVGGDFHCRYDPQTNCAYCDTDYHNMDRAVEFRTYLVIRFAENAVDPNRTAASEQGLHLALRQPCCEAQLAISYISEEQATCNLNAEAAGFASALKNAGEIWEKRLSSIEIEADDATVRTFYSCLYRTFLFPHKAYELDPDGNELHYCPGDGRIRPGKRYTDNGFWDTYRTVFPLFSIIAPQDYAEMLDGFTADYRDNGWLPRWPSIGEVGCMPSTLIDAVIADAAVKGIAPHELLETALEGMLHHATTDAPEKRFGRNGATAYRKYGYVPRELERESVNLTLDAAYGDFCIAETARVLGKTDVEAEYRPLAKNYRNLFDPVSGFMRGKDTAGKMTEEFDCCSWGGEYTEGSAWQNSFAVPHDVDGLAELYGGKDKLTEKLDELFTAPPVYRVGWYGCEIHEMTEMAAVDFSQCAISNQPSFHIPYLYAALGRRDKSVYWIDKICRELFSAADDGFPGDEDNGSMSAWYLFGVLGFYPLCPGKPDYVNLGRMLADRAKINGREWDPAAFPGDIPHSAFRKEQTSFR